MPFSSGLSRPSGSPLQNRPELLVSIVASVVAEAVFVQVALQVLGRDGVIDSANPSLNQHPESFDRVGVGMSANIFTCAVLDGEVEVIRRSTVRELHFGDTAIARKLVSVDDALRNDMLANHRHDGVAANVLNYFRNCLPLALDDANNRAQSLVAAHRTPAFAFAPSAHVSFVDLHRRPLQFQVIVGEKRADLFEDSPRGFVGDASLALNLLRGDAATSGTHQVHCVEPSPQGSRGLLENGSLERVGMIPAMVAGERGAIAYAVMLAVLLALRAMAHAVRETLLSDIAKAGVIVREFVIEVLHAVPELSRNALFDFHISLTEKSIPEHLLVVKGYLPCLF